MKQLVLPILLLLTLGMPVLADYAKGLDAVNNGDYKTAFKEWVPLAQLGHPDAQFKLGLLYDNGWGVDQDYSSALKWYASAAEQGHRMAQGNLGFMYASGQGVTQDYRAAFKWYRLAAEQGHSSAQANLAFMYDNGQGVARDPVRAHMWWNISALYGNKVGEKNRDIVAKIMSSSEIAASNKLAEDCVEKALKQC